MKKSLLFLALGLAASVQAQNTPAPVAQPQNPVTTVAPVAPQTDAKATQAEAPAVKPVQQAAPEATPAAQSAPVAEKAPAADTTAAVTKEPEPKAAEPANAPIAQDVAPVAEKAPAADTTAAVTKEPEPKAAEPASAPATQEVAPVAEKAPVADTTAAVTKEPEVKTEKPAIASPLNAIHGSAYNTVGNEAAGATIGSNMSSPHRMHGVKLAYFDPINEQGVVSFGNSHTYFFGLDNSLDLGLITFGMAFSKFGFSIDAALGRDWTFKDIADGSEEKSRNSMAGTQLGANFSFKAGNFSIFAKGHYVNPEAEYFASSTYDEVDHKAWDATGRIGASYSGKSIYWTLAINGLRHDAKTLTKKAEVVVVDGANKLSVTKTEISDSLSRIEGSGEFTIGAAVLSSENANVYLGVNTFVPVAMFDEIEGICDRHNEYALIAVPNIFGEVALSQYFMAFAGASYNWELGYYSDRKLNGNRERFMESTSGRTSVDLGARFQYSNIAVEMAFTKQFLNNPFGAFADTAEIVSSLGAFIYF